MGSYATLDVPPPTSFFGQRVFSWAWPYLVKTAKRTIISALEHGIKTGTLEISDDTDYYVFGEKTPSSVHRHASLVVRNEAFWVRVFLFYDIGFAEAFMGQEIDSPDMKEVLNLYVDNLPNLGGLSTTLYRLQSVIDVTIRYIGSYGLMKSVDNVAGYDASNDLYKAFLSTEMQYSCPIWAEEEGGVRGDLEGHRRPNDLETAQARKIAFILQKARLRPGDRLLEIGSGWGSAAIAAAKMGCTVDTLTLSIEQKNLAEARVAEAGLADRVRVHFMDYRQMPPHFEKAFDACISIEMLEAVGAKNMHHYVKMIDWALKSERAAAVLTSTTYPEGTYSPYQGNDFVRKYHWPNGVSPSATSLASDFLSHAQGRFSLENVQDFGTHYPRCLREWGRRLEEHWDDELLESLQNRYPELKDEYRRETFKRRWQYMFMYMDVAYSRVWLSCHCWCFVRPGNAGTPCS